MQNKEIKSDMLHTDHKIEDINVDEINIDEIPNLPDSLLVHLIKNVDINDDKFLIATGVLIQRNKELNDRAVQVLKSK